MFPFAPFFRFRRYVPKCFSNDGRQISTNRKQNRWNGIIHISMSNIWPFYFRFSVSCSSEVPHIYVRTNLKNSSYGIRRAPSNLSSNFQEVCRFLITAMTLFVFPWRVRLLLGRLPCCVICWATMSHYAVLPELPMLMVVSTIWPDFAIYHKLEYVRVYHIYINKHLEREIHSIHVLWNITQLITTNYLLGNTKKSVPFCNKIIWHIK